MSRTEDSEPLFTWLHLSDLHFGHGGATHRWNQQLVLETLRADVADLAARGVPKPDVILVTGDIAFSGAASQYENATAWLGQVGSALGIGLDRVFVVPGNHDVDRKADQDRDTGRLVRALREGEEELDAALGHEGDRRRLLGRAQAYRDFATGLGKVDAGASGMWWTARLAGRGGLRVRLAGINTALLAADNQDLGRLRLGQGAIAGAFPTGPEPGELVVALTHHPLDRGWLKGEAEAMGWMRKRAHVHLCGHVHEAESKAVRAGSGVGMVHVVAGAAHGEGMPEGMHAGHGYNVAGVFAGAEGALHLRVWPRRWADTNKDFRPDMERVEEKTGYAKHELPVRIAEVNVGAQKPPVTMGMLVNPALQQAAAKTQVGAEKPLATLGMLGNPKLQQTADKAHVGAAGRGIRAATPLSDEAPRGPRSRLTPPMRRALEAALLDGFRNEAALKQMVRHGLDKNLAELVALGQPLRVVVYELVDAADAGGFVRELAMAAWKANPDNDALDEVRHLFGW